MSKPASGGGDLSLRDIPPRLNLGCGEDYRPGYWNVDISDGVLTDQLLDLENIPWALPSDHFTHVLAEHVVEHVSDPVEVMREMARVAKPGGYVEIAVPTGINARTDPTHRNEWTYQTPEYFDENGPYSWEAGCNLSLRTREFSIHTHGPMRYLSPLVQTWARFHPMSAADIPATSGELRAVYEVMP